MMKLNPYVLGIISGGLFALGHLVWGVMVATGVASNFLDYVLRMHFLNNPFLVMKFDLGRWLMLLVSSFIAGFLVGTLSSYLWNYLRKKDK